MEKVIVVEKYFSSLNQNDVEEVNTLLQQGWTVKHFRTIANKDFTTAVFVLQWGN